MARPTSDPKTRTIRIRVNADVAEQINGLGDNVSETVRNLLEVGLKNRGGADFVPQKKHDATLICGSNETHIRELQKICNKQRKEIATLEKELEGLKKPGKEKSDNSESVERLQAELSAVRSENEWLVCRIRELENAAPIDKGGERFDTSDLTELESMALASGMTLDGLLSEFRAKLESGEIGIGVYGLSVGTVDECPFDWRMFTNACDEMSYDYGEAMKKLIPMLFRV